MRAAAAAATAERGGAIGRALVFSGSLLPAASAPIVVVSFRRQTEQGMHQGGYPGGAQRGRHERLSVRKFSPLFAGALMFAGRPRPVVPQGGK